MSQDQKAYDASGAAGTALTDASRGRYADIPVVRDTLGMQLMPSNFGEMVSFAQMMAKSGAMVRAVFRDNPGACLGITMKAARWGFDPWDVANKSYFVNDQMAFEGQLIHAIILTSGLITEDDVDFDFTGEGDDMRVVVRATIKKNNKTREYESPRLKDIDPKRSPLWKSDPAQQLIYYGITKWARRWLPTVLMGVAWREELPGDEAKDVTPKPSSEQNAARLSEKLQGAGDGGRQNFNPAEIEREASALAGDTPAEDPKSDASPAAENWDMRLEQFQREIEPFTDQDTLNSFVSAYGEKQGQEWWSDAPDDVQARATALFEARWKSLAPAPEADDDAGDVTDDGPTDAELLQDLEESCAACKTVAELDAVFASIDGPEGWYAAVDGADRRVAASQIVSRHRERIEASTKKPAREEKASRKKPAKSDDPPPREAAPELVAKVEKQTAKGVKRFKLWCAGNLTADEQTEIAPELPRLLKLAEQADASL